MAAAQKAITPAAIQMRTRMGCRHGIGSALDGWSGGMGSSIAVTVGPRPTAAAPAFP